MNRISTCRDGYPSKDNRPLWADLAWGGMDEIFLGEYELSVSSAVEALARPGDFCIDVGANIGWFTTLLARSVVVEGTTNKSGIDSKDCSPP